MRIQDALMGIAGLVLFPVFLVLSVALMVVMFFLLALVCSLVGIIQVVDLVTFKYFSIEERLLKYLERKSEESHGS